LISGFFAATLGLVATAPVPAYADSGSKTSTDSHPVRGGGQGSSTASSTQGATVVSRATAHPASSVPPVSSSPATGAAAHTSSRASLAEIVKNVSITPGTTKTPIATPPTKAATPKTFNLGLGNVGRFNVGAGNKGDWNFGNGNLGSTNVGFGNLGDKNFGIGNTGNGNVGGGNTGTGNIGFGNTGTGNIGIGLTGDHQIGFGGFNSGTGNKGLFNSGDGNKGWFNSGTGNSGFGNAGSTNTGRFNVGDTNTGNANVGDLNTGSFDVGNSNGGSFNPGSTNTGWFNSGGLNTGWFNSGDSNTGLFNSGYLNTGAFNSGNASNGFFQKQDNQNWFPGIHIAYTVPGMSIDKTLPLDINKQIAVGPFTLTVGPTTVEAHVTGSTGPIQITVLDIPAGPGFFNTGAVASSGFFNTGAGGGSGLLNTGAGLASGFFNEALQAGIGLSGYSSAGSGSGFSNLGSAVSGSKNTSSLDPAVAAFLSGIGNIGALLSGTYTNKVTGTSTFNLGSGNVGFGNAGTGNQGKHNLGSGNEGDGNLGLGNTGDKNFGSGNGGDKNFGNGNAGSNNVGSGNLGNKNFGWGNNGSGNVGAGNTGNGNIGFGNTGTGNIGIGLTGDHQFGFGGFNSGTGNKGLFNSGTGNTGFFNSGSHNWGIGNSGSLNTGLFNPGSTNSGVGNAGDLNTGLFNGGSSNTGIGNAGDTNSGLTNIGDRNTGWANNGSANTGWANEGDLNTGAYNGGNGNNGLFWRSNGGGQLHIDLGADLSQVPITLNVDIPINIPITAELTNPISIPSIELPANPINTSITTQVELVPGLNADIVIAANGSLGPITFPGTTITVPQVVGTLGGPGVSIPFTLTGTVGPGRISLLRFEGPGFFNSTDAPSSGLFNSGAGGGSGFFNSGAAGISGLNNEALQPGLSGNGNTGSGSGSSNLGSAISGRKNTSSLEDPALSAFVSGLRNVGTNLSGIFVKQGSGKSAGNTGLLGRRGWQLGINTDVDLSAIPINLDGSIGVNVPLSASLTGPITIGGFTIPAIPGNLATGSQLSISVPNLFGPAVIPLTTDLGIGPITVPDINITAADPLLSGLIGGSGTTIPIHIGGAIGPNSTSHPTQLTLTRTASPGLSVNVHANVAQTPITLNGDIPVDVPFAANFGDLTLQGVTIPGFNVNTSNWQIVRNQATSAPLGNVYLDFNVPSTTLPIGDITLDPITVKLPSLSGSIGGPTAGFGLNLDAGIGAFTIDAPIGVTVLPSPSINLDQVLISQIPLGANLGFTADVPVSLDATPLTISPISLSQVTIGTAPIGTALQGLVFQGAIKSYTSPPAVTGVIGLRNVCLQACIALQLSPVINLGPIATGPIVVGFPNDRALSLNIGGPGKGIDAGVAGSLGPIVVSLANGEIEKFPYAYQGQISTDIPIDGATGQLDLQQVDLSVPLQALLYQRVGYCAAGGLTCTGMTVAQMVSYVNGGSPPGSAPGPFPPNIPVTSSTLIDTDLGQPIGPLTLVPSIPISQGITNETPFSGSGTLGPIPLAA